VSPQEVPSRREAIRILREGRGRTLELVGRLPARAVTTPGLGGGEWSPKDVVGHLASWEEYALDALSAWDRGARAPIDELQFSVGTNRINRQNVDAKASWSLAKVLREGERTHAELVAAIDSMADARWRSPATPRGRKPLGGRIGGILGGPAGWFRHDDAHHESLVAFVDEHVAGRP
jgi:hypothetical protein